MQQKIQTIDKRNVKSCHWRFMRKLTGFQTLNYTVYVHVSSVTPFVFLILVPKWCLVMDVGVKLKGGKKNNATTHTLYCIFGAV